jgi:cephalosporin hydroxylase
MRVYDIARQERMSAGMLPTPVVIQQTPWEFRKFLELCDEIGARRVLEVGCYRGGTLYHFLQRAIPGDVVVAIDWSAGYGAEPETPTHYPLWRAWVPAGVTFNQIDADSQAEKTRDWALNVGAPYDCIFVDSDHHTEAVLRDFDLYFPLLRDGGIMGLHDMNCYWNPGETDVQGAWIALMRKGYLMQAIIAGEKSETNGIGVIYK